MRLRFFTPYFALSLALGLCTLQNSARASVYWEAGFGLGSLSKGSTYFGQSGANSTKSGTVVTGAIFLPITDEGNELHLEVGVLDHLTSSSISSTNSSLAMNTVNLGARVEFWRFYVGGGYGLLNMVSSAGSGVTSLHSYANTHSYYYEFGVIWRVIPEFQIAASGSFEYGSPPGGSSPSPSTGYGLNFRFPLDPKEHHGKGAVDFDGFRYPFGFMR